MTFLKSSQPDLVSDWLVWAVAVPHKHLVAGSGQIDPEHRHTWIWYADRHRSRTGAVWCRILLGFAPFCEMCSLSITQITPKGEASMNIKELEPTARAPRLSPDVMRALLTQFLQLPTS